MQKLAQKKTRTHKDDILMHLNQISYYLIDNKMSFLEQVQVARELYKLGGKFYKDSLIKKEYENWGRKYCNIFYFKKNYKELKRRYEDGAI